MPAVHSHDHPDGHLCLSRVLAEIVVEKHMLTVIDFLLEGGEFPIRLTEQKEEPCHISHVFTLPITVAFSQFNRFLRVILHRIGFFVHIEGGSLPVQSNPVTPRPEDCRLGIPCYSRINNRVNGVMQDHRVIVRYLNPILIIWHKPAVSIVDFPKIFLVRGERLETINHLIIFTGSRDDLTFIWSMDGSKARHRRDSVPRFFHASSL